MFRKEGTVRRQRVSYICYFFPSQPHLLLLSPRCTEEEIEKELASYRQELIEKSAKAAEVKEPKYKIYLDSSGRPR